jgi:hypothetical protein
VASVSTLRDGIGRMVGNGEGYRHLWERGISECRPLRGHK